MRYVWLVVLLSSWVGAFGIAVGVHEWRDVEQPPAAVETGPDKAELDAQKCEAALIAAGESVSGGPVAIESDLSFGRSVSPVVPQVIQDTINRYC